MDYELISQSVIVCYAISQKRSTKLFAPYSPICRILTDRLAPAADNLQQDIIKFPISPERCRYATLRR